MNRCLPVPMNIEKIKFATSKAFDRVSAFLLKRAMYVLQRFHRPHHIVIGASTLMLCASLLLVLLISGKSRKARAEDRAVIEIALPEETQVLHYHRLMELAAIPATTAPEANEDPLAIDMEAAPAPKTVAYKTISAEAALSVRPGVMLTDDLATFADGLAQYLATHHFQATITSGVRSSDRQLEIIKEKIARAGMSRAFPKLAYASVMDVDAWMPAWEWLKSRRIPVNPPATVVKSDGSEVGASLHTKGLALDVVSGSLNALTQILVQYGNTQIPAGSLHMTSLTRERDCVHIALAR